MHTVFSLEESSQWGFWEAILHFKEMYHFWHASALFHNLIQILVWGIYKFINWVLIGEHAILLIVLEHTQVWFSRHQKSLFNNIDKTETKEIKRNVHEIRRTIWHQSNDLIAYYLTVSCICNMLLNDSLIVSFFHVEMFTFSDELFWKFGGHDIFKFKENVEEFLSENTQVLLL